MRWPWQVRQARRGTAARLGLSGIVPVRPATGHGFGAIVGSGGELTALLWLQGGPLWLDDQATIDRTLAGLAAALAGPPIKLLLRRRRIDPAAAVRGWQLLVRACVADLDAQDAFEAGYARAMSAQVAAGGLASVAVVVAVAGNGPAQLGQRVASLQRALGDGVSALSVPELVGWVRDWAGANDLAPATRQDQAVAAAHLAPASLRVTDTALMLGDEPPVRFWQAAGLPSLIELDWVRHLLADPVLAGRDWDLCLECRPSEDVDGERLATSRAVRAIDARLTHRLRRGRHPARSGARPLLTQRDELTRRLSALDGTGHELRHITFWLAARGDEEQSAALEDAARRRGLHVEPVQGRLAVERGWQSVGPVVQRSGLAPATHVFTVAELAPLARWVMSPDQAAPVWPPTMVTPELVPVVTPAVAVETEHLLVTGDDGEAMRQAAQAWSLEVALRGGAVLTLQAGDAWTALATTVGGRACWLGPDGDTGIDLVASDGWAMETRAGWLAWLDASTLGVSGMLGDDLAVAEDVRVGLIELGQAWLTRRQTPTLDLLVDRLAASGYAATAERLARALAGRWRWLAGPSLSLASLDGMTAIGWAGGDREAYAQVVTWLARRLRPQPRISRGRRPLTVVVDDGPLVLAELRTAAALTDLVRDERAARTRVWLLAGPSRGLDTTEGRLLAANVALRAAFAERAARPHELIEVGGWTELAARLIATLPTDALLLRHGRALTLARMISGPVVDTVMEAANGPGRAAGNVAGVRLVSV